MLSDDDVADIKLAIPDARVLRLCESHDELRKIVRQLSERCQNQSELLSRAAERKKEGPP